MEELTNLKEIVSYKTNNQKFDKQAEFIASQIKSYLLNISKEDENLNKCLQYGTKDFGECMIYVMNRAFENPEESSDDACYQNARHYYLEEEIDAKELTIKFMGQAIRSSAPSKEDKKLTEAEIKKLKQEAVEEYKKSLEEKANAKAEAKKQKELEKEKKQEESKMSLFDWDD